MNNFYDKISDILLKINKKFDIISEKIYESTGKKINVGMIALIIIIFIFLIIFVKSFLGWLITLL